MIQEVTDGICQCTGIAGRHQKPGLSMHNSLTAATNAGGNYRKFAAHGFEHRTRKAFTIRRQDKKVHRAGEKMFVDYAGDTIPIHDPRTGAFLRFSAG
jgi:hypothetical protein